MGAKMMFDLVVKNGRIVTSDQIFSANVGVKGETIAAILHRGCRLKQETWLMQKGNTYSLAALTAMRT